MAKMTAYNNIAGLDRALRRLPKQASAKLRGASAGIADVVAQHARVRAFEVGGVARLIAPTIKASRDRVPVVKMGGTARLPAFGTGWERERTGTRQTVGDVIWGGEFGGGKRPSTTQFMPHLGQVGYFLWPTVRDDAGIIRETYSEALLDALEATT